MEVSTSVTYRFVLLLFTLPVAIGHGMMIEPAMRSSLWRYDYPGAEPNYNDNGLNCGGFTNQHERQHGRCGVCGDPYQGPRDNEAGGKYAKGIIARTYKSGQYITVVSDITANHDGYIELKLCPHNNVQVPVTQQCLNQYPLSIRGHGTRYYLTSKQKADFKIRHTVKLPDYVTCRQCVLQWYWRAGQHNGIDPVTNRECMGCGKQEEFINCADIAITDEYGMFPSVTTVPPLLQITTPYSMYDSYMYQGQAMSPDYFEEYNPFFFQPSQFNPYINNRPGFRQFIGSTFDSRGNVPQNNVGFGHGGGNGLGQSGHLGNGGGNGFIQSGNTHSGNGFTQRGDRMQQQDFRMGGNVPPNSARNRNINPPVYNNRYIPTGNNRPLVSRNNRPQINVNKRIIPQIQRPSIRTEMRNTRPTVIRNRVLPVEDSDQIGIMEDMMDDDDNFLHNVQFWKDFNALLNVSTPETKEALYEIAEDADNIEEFHRNVKLMLQMQQNGQQSLPETGSDSDESLDMDWLLNEAKEMELNSDEQSLLGFTQKEKKLGEFQVKQEESPKRKHKVQDESQGFNHFQDENRVLDDSDSDGSFSDQFDENHKDHKNDASKPYRYNRPSDEDTSIENNKETKDYDSDDANMYSEMKIDDHYINFANQPSAKTNRQPVHMNSKTDEIFTSRINPWNENSLYKTKNVDYDDKDVDVEEDFSKRFESLEVQNVPTTTRPLTSSNAVVIDIKYAESDTRDYTDSEVENEEDEDKSDVDKSWEDYTEEKDENDNWEANTEEQNEKDEKDIWGDDTNDKEDTDDKEHWSAENEPETEIAIENEDEGADTKKDEVTGNKDNKIKPYDKLKPDEDQEENKDAEKNDENVIASKENENILNENELVSKTEKSDVINNALDDIGDTISKTEELKESVLEDNSIVEKLSVDAESIGKLSTDDSPLGNGLYDITKLKTDDSLQNEMIKKLDDVKDITNNILSEDHQHNIESIAEIGDRPRNEELHIIDDVHKKGLNFDDLKLGPGIGMPNPTFLPQNRFLPGDIVQTTIFPTVFTQMKHKATIVNNMKQHRKVPNHQLSVFRRRIQDKISKSMGQKDQAVNSASISLPVKSAGSTGSKKALSPSLSKLVLKMFMNTKSTPMSCSSGLQSACYPVTLWSKYQQVADWCTSLCPYGNCPSAVCKCACESKSSGSGQKKCRAQSAFQEKSGELDKWCSKNCSAGDCPDLLCVCT